MILDYDLNAALSPLGISILSELGLNELPQLVDWVGQADKMQMARLAPIVLRAAVSGDTAMQKLIEKRARELAEFTAAVGGRLGMDQPDVRLFGGILAHDKYYADRYRFYLQERLPGARVDVSLQSGAFGAAHLAMREKGKNTEAIDAPTKPTEIEPAQGVELAAALTEQVHPRAMELDGMSAPELVALFVVEEKRVAAALAICGEALTDAVRSRRQHCGKVDGCFMLALERVDVSACWMRARSHRPLVHSRNYTGNHRGGPTALTRSIEAAEDSPEAGAAAIVGRGVQRGDVVCGIAASGRTPFVLGSLARARERGAKTILLTCNPARSRIKKVTWDVEIDLPTGPEIVTGSTRLKAGTATKVALNILTTCTMIRLGHVRGGAMVDLRATNAKLRDRATRIVQTALSCDASRARDLLAQNAWNIRQALEAALPKR